MSYVTFLVTAKIILHANLLYQNPIYIIITLYLTQNIMLLLVFTGALLIFLFVSLFSPCV